MDKVSARDKIHPQGCLKMLESLYQRDLEPGLMILAIICIAVVLVEYTTVALSFGFVARIRRKEKKYEMANRSYEMDQRETRF